MNWQQEVPRCLVSYLLAAPALNLQKMVMGVLPRIARVGCHALDTRMKTNMFVGLRAVRCLHESSQRLRQ